jgi:Tfp pilus assembly PilM family ATPase
MIALYNFAQFQRSATDADRPTVLIDLGANRLNVLASSSQQLWHRSVMFGADQINKALVREFKLTYSQAEEWKRNPTLAPSIGKYYETLQPVYEVYDEEILDSLAAYRKLYPAEEIARLLGCGGGMAAHDLPRYLLWRR